MPLTNPTPLPAAHDAPAYEALRRATADLGAVQANGRPFEMTQALAQLARCYRGIGATEMATTSFEQALLWSAFAGSIDGTVDLLCELGETAALRADELDDGAPRSGRGHAARERARDHAFEAATLAARVADPRWEIVVLLRISQVLERCGDRDDAMSMQTRALRLLAGDLATPADLTLPPALADC